MMMETQTEDEMEDGRGTWVYRALQALNLKPCALSSKP